MSPAFAPGMEIKVAQGRLFLCLESMLPKPESACLNPHQAMDAGRAYGLSHFYKVLPAHDPEKIHHSPGYVKARTAKPEMSRIHDN